MTGVQTCALDRKSTRLNSSHTIISYAVFCLKKKAHRRGVAHLVPAQQLDAVRLVGRAAGGCRPASRRPVSCVCARRSRLVSPFFFFNEAAPPETFPLSLHGPLPI